MKALLGILLIIAGVVLGIYIGLWVMFVGGIIAIVHAMQMDPVNASGIAWGIVRIVFASAVGAISFWILALPGIGLLALSKK